MPNVQNIIKLTTDSIYFTSRLECTLESKKPIKIGFKKEYIQFIENCKVISSDGDACWLDCTSSSKLVLYKPFSNREKALFTGSDTDYPLVESTLELFIATDSQYETLLELHIPNDFKARFGTHKEKISYLLLDLFGWDDVPGKDNGKLIEFLERRFGLSWVKTAKIEKTDSGRTIIITNGKNSLSLELNDEKTEVKMEIDHSGKDKLVVKTENEKSNVYGKIDLYSYSSGAGMEYRLDKNIYFFTIPKGRHNCNLHMIFIPNHRLLLRSSVPWLQTLFLFILWLIFPNSIQNNIENVRLFFSATYGGYVIALTRSRAPYLSCLENHWIGFLFILVSIFGILLWFYPSPTLILGIVIAFVILSILNFVLLLNFYFTAAYPKKLMNLYRYPNKIYGGANRIAIGATKRS